MPPLKLRRFNFPSNEYFVSAVNCALHYAQVFFLFFGRGREGGLIAKGARGMTSSLHS